MAQVQAMRTRVKQQQARFTQIETPTLPQVVAANGPHSTVVQAVDQQQSFEMVQTLLMSSLANLAYLRDLFPDMCFGQRDYAAVPRDLHCSYKSFVNDNLPLTDSLAVVKQSKASGARPLMILLRGKTPQVDKVLEWLDGIFDALRKSVLAAVQFSISADEANPSNVIETYTFSFTYTGNVNIVGRRLAEMTVAGPNGKRITVQDARAGLRSIVRQCMVLNNILPCLPDNCFLTCHLFYTPDCPRTFDPPGFAACSDSMRIPSDEVWKMEVTNCGRMDAGYHSVGLEIASLMPASDNQAAGSAGLLQIPQKLTYTKNVPRLQVGEVRGDGIASLRNEAHTNTTWMQEKHQKPQDDQGISPLGTTQKAQDEHFSTAQGPNGDALKDKSFEIFQIETASHSHDQVATQIESLNNPQWGYSASWVISPGRLAELAKKHKGNMQRSERDAQDAEKQVVQCQCAWGNEEGDMVECECCYTWQHLHCYGYRGTRPLEHDTHVCYRCLLEGTEDALLLKITELARVRRALWVIYDEDFSRSNKTVSQTLLHVKSQVIKRLKDEGFVIRASSQGKSSSKRARSEKFIVNYDPVVVSARDRDYFNPLVWIDHHYELRQSNVSPNSQIPHAMSASTQATDGKETEHGDKDEEVGDTENQTDELVEIMPSSSAPKSSRWKNISGSSTVPLPMGPPKRPLPSDHTQRRKRMKE
ncbi:Zinc finger, RING/FYVE/PHD-type [Lasallia pustulata]|uniref:Zinc finger, RING/FYVE/PHD-type n=1 Tax=Lasallia pustulata TaxID=136370 RepID=A0A1W5CRB1_9LECA|nr:Zinc finger, RING/FYVE/PHD-type [Lasallia pustulata]